MIELSQGADLNFQIELTTQCRPWRILISRAELIDHIAP
jgi:hypothetical protein